MTVTHRDAHPRSSNDPVVDWLLDTDPSIRWQVMRDLTGTPAEIVGDLAPRRGEGQRRRAAHADAAGPRRAARRDREQRAPLPRTVRDVAPESPHCDRSVSIAVGAGVAARAKWLYSFH
jgi:hypothetical protein